MTYQVNEHGFNNYSVLILMYLYRHKKINFNAAKLRATNKGKIAVETLSSQDGIKAAINQLNKITGIIGYTAMDIPKIFQG